MNEQTYKSIVTKCWGDPEFKQRLIADPLATLRAEGVPVPDGVKVSVVENTATEFTFVIPPESSELSDEALEGLSGGQSIIVEKGVPMEEIKRRAQELDSQAKHLIAGVFYSNR